MDCKTEKERDGEGGGGGEREPTHIYMYMYKCTYMYKINYILCTFTCTMYNSDMVLHVHALTQCPDLPCRR